VAVTRGILYLTEADVDACGISPAEMNAAVEDAFLAAARGAAATRPALSIPAGGRSSFRAKGGVVHGAGFGAVKWYGYFPGNADAGLPEYRPLILLNETETGFPVAIIAGGRITAMRTAAISAVGAKHLARPDSAVVGFVGCGIQARANLLALLPVLPIRHVVLHGRRPETAAAFADFARAQGVTAVVADEAREAVREADIVITTVPRLSSRTGFLDAGWVAPGGFVSMVDSGVSWSSDTLAAFAARFSDDVEQSTGHAEAGDAVAAYHGSLAEIVGGARPGRRSPQDRIALIFSGTGLADAAAAIAVYRRALRSDLGRVLPL
jgi:ornithine cyclodeaminase/alanine dehydrogenase